MAVALEFIDLIVPRTVIERVYPGGWDGCLEHHEDVIGGAVWHDDHLLREGAMSPDGITWLIDRWRERGIEPYGEREGQKYWKDCCVVEGMFGGKTLPCDWLEIAPDRRSVYLTGTEPGEKAGPKPRRAPKGLGGRRD